MNFIILCLISILFNKRWFIWFRIVFILNVIWFFVLLIFPHSSNSAFLPVLLILAVRSYIWKAVKKKGNIVALLVL